MLEQLFTFPVVTIDGDNEERKQIRKERLALPEDEEESGYDIVFGEAEYPYYDFIGIEDRWLPNEESLEKALRGKFTACLVRFANAGQLLVPWSRKKFKEELQKFADQYEASRPPKEEGQIRILNLTPAQFEEATQTKKSE